MKYRHLVSAMALVVSGGLIWAAGGCALIVGADFSERTIGDTSNEGDPCYTGPAGTQDVGPCVAGRIEGGVCVGEVTPAPEVCVSPEDESCDGFEDCNGALIELQTFGNEAVQTEPRVVVDAAGFIYLALDADGPVDYGGGLIGTEGGRDVHLIKLDPDLQHVWSMDIGGGDEHNLRALALDGEGNVIIAGMFRGAVSIGGQELAGNGDGSQDIFIAKITGDQQVAWARSWTGNNDASPRSVAVGSDGGVVVAGGFVDTLDLGDGTTLTSAGDRDIFVGKLGGDGNVLWAQRFGDPFYQEAFGVAMSGGGDVALTGIAWGTLDLGVPSPVATSSVTDNGFLALLEPDGTPRWSKGFVSGTGRVVPIDVAVDPGGRVLITGYHEIGDADFGGGPLAHAGGQDAFLAAFALVDGARLWAQSYGDVTNQVGYRLSVDTAGQLLWAGTAQGTTRFGSQDYVAVGDFDGFVVKLATVTAQEPGAVIWAKLIGQEGYQSALDVAYGPFGGVISTGFTDSDFKIGTTGVAHAGGGDVWIAAFLP